MKKVKINLLAIVGLMVAVGTLAFTAPKEVALEELHWFEVTQNANNDNEFGDKIPTGQNGLPALDCTSTETYMPLCAVGLEDSEVSGDDPIISSPDDAEPENKRYKDE